MSRSQDDVYQRLKHAITHFEIRPGARLIEDEISRRFGVSRTPVREALRQLEQDGLVIATDGRGRFARDIALRDYEDVSAVRLVLEDLAVRQACERAATDAIRALKHACSQGGDTPPDGTYVYVDEGFHTGVAKLADNTFLSESLARVNDRIRIIRLTDFTVVERIQIVEAEHNQILDAILRRDGEEARDLMRRHIERSQVNIRQLIARALANAYLDGSVANVEGLRRHELIDTQEV